MNFFFIILIIFFNIIFLNNIVNWNLSFDVNNSCIYKNELKRCLDANNSLSWETPFSIEDFVCMTSNNPHKILSQIILDYKFREIDEEIYTFLQDLSDNKFTFFSPNAEASFIDWINLIEEKFDIFTKKYQKACWINWDITQEIIQCYKKPWINIRLVSWDFFKNCNSLATIKLTNQRQVSYNILKMNKHLIHRDLRTIYQEEQRTMYDKIVEKFYIQLSYIQRIWKKWNDRVKDTY